MYSTCKERGREKLWNLDNIRKRMCLLLLMQEITAGVIRSLLHNYK